MADDDRPHFRIPSEAAYSDAVTRKGFGIRIEREDFAEHGQFLLDRTRSFRAASAEARDSASVGQMFVKVQVPEVTNVKNEKQRLRNAGLEVVTYSKFQETSGTARITREDLDTLEQKLLRYALEPDHPGRSYLAVLEDLGSVPPAEKISEDLRAVDSPQLDCILYLFPGLSSREVRSVLGDLEAYVEEQGGEVLESHSFSSGVTTVRVLLPSETLDDLGRSFSTLRQVTPTRAYFVEDSTAYAPLPNPVQVNTPPRGASGVAVVDSGVHPACAILAPAVRGVDSRLPAGSVAPALGHGTYVASRIAFGDDLETLLQSPPLVPRCSLHDVPVFGVDAGGRDVPVDELHLAKAVDGALSALPDWVRVVNLSLGTNAPIVDGEYSLLAATLDHLSRAHDLVVVTTAGNVRDTNLIRGFPGTVALPDFRIDSPGESLLAITVGSVARYGDPSTFSQPGELSPFSRVGPGADRGLKPELVSHGGNYVRPGLPSSRFATHGVHKDGLSLGYDFGTSFAAPLVAGAAAEVFQAYPDATANLVKALLCHFTEPADVPGGHPHPVSLVGLGQPSVLQAIRAKDHAATFLFVGDMEVANYLHLPFFVPDALAAHNPHSRLRVRCTVVYDPPVNVSNPTEYSKARMAAAIRKPVQVGFREVAIGAGTKVAQPWNPIIHLDKLFHRSYEGGAWELRLRLWTRDLPEDFRQSFAAVIEVIDDKGTVDVWQDVSDEAGEVFQPMTVHVAA